MGDAIPYELVYGQVPQVGISFLPLAPVILDSLHTEAQYCQALFSVNADGVEGSLEVEDNGNVDVDDATSEEDLLREADDVDDAQSGHSLSNNYPAFAGLNLILVTFVFSSIRVLLQSRYRVTEVLRGICRCQQS